MYVSMEHMCDDINKKKYSENSMFQCHFVHHKSHMD